ncbi:hypothetical protein ACEQ8H_000415 [Pleosporales sp. CAS-2024a]
MSSIRLATAANVLAFQNLTNALNTSDGKWAHLLDYNELADEVGRFRVWSGNLGALQKGHSSLDYRLRDSPLLSSNALKFLKELENNINEAHAIVSEARLPYELQPKPEITDDEDEFFDDDDDDNEGTRTELSMRWSEMVDIIDNLYKLSVRIRTPTLRTRSLKAANYKPKDPETGIDLLSTYANYDLQHVKELLQYLRLPYKAEVEPESYQHDYLADRLSAAITLRRRQFKYWKRHGDKLGMATVQEEAHLDLPVVERHELPDRIDTLEVLREIPIIVHDKDALSQKTGKTLLSGTEATQHHQSLDDIVDSRSVTSYAVTVKDIHGRGVELPPPPQAADGEKDFECPYCYIICPARYGSRRAWRMHLLQDLQPYICTYPTCNSPEQLFRSRREWAEHEATHRKVWRCPEHPAAVYKNSAGLEEHFRHEHADDFAQSQLAAIIKVGETSMVDARERCPICSAPADVDGLGDFHNHIAHHLERFATFALPNGREDDLGGASSVASRGRSASSGSRNISDLSLPVEPPGASDSSEELSRLDEIHSDEGSVQGAATGALLSTESLQQLPDGRQERLEMLYTSAEQGSDDGSATSRSEAEGGRYHALESYAIDESDHSKLATLDVSSIPTLRSLYRRRRLQERDDRSFAPNDKFNQIIAFCHHDLTRLRVDAIVNSAHKTLRMTGGKTLNNTIHRAAGPGLANETRLAGQLNDQALLTRGHNLPSKHVIHVLRSGYSKPRGMELFKQQLAYCYRDVFQVAIYNNLKTIAFPCLGTGRIGCPALVAAQITLQYIREYLDAHPEHGLERIIFCVNTDADEKAYMDFLPVYFPPTHDDLESGRGIRSEDYAAVATEVLDTRNEVQNVFSELNLGLSFSVPGFPRDILTSFAAISSGLTSIRRFLWSNDVDKNIRDLKLVCTVLRLFCGNITEIIDLAKDHANLGQRSDQSIWDDYVADMNTRLQTNPSEFLQLCSDLVEGLNNMITGNGYDLDEVMEMVDTRTKLERYKSKQRDGREDAGTQDHLNEDLYTREFQRESIAQSRDTVKLYQVRSVAQLYALGELEEKPTLAHPSEILNDKVYLVREDITKLEVDILVNSTDVAYRGIGTLDRTVLQKGGEQLRSAAMAFDRCDIGSVKVTEGYLLPAKHVMHVVPSGTYNKDSKGILQKIYREVLHEAVRMRAASVALPCLGTGMLKYPRDCASLALKEVKRFLESAEHDSPLEKIIFVVFSSNDEFVYKSVLPVYFPPLETGVGTSLRPVSRPGTALSTSLVSSDAPRRIGGSERIYSREKQKEALRPISTSEEHALIEFESHAKECETCRDVGKLYLEGRDLCKEGYFLAQTVLWHMHMQPDQEVYTKPDVSGQSMRLELPADMFPISMQMLSIVDESYGDKARSRPFVTPNRTYNAIVQDQAHESLGTQQGPKIARARVYVTLEDASEPTAVWTRESQVRVYPNRVDVFPQVDAGSSQIPLLSLGLNDTSLVQRRKTTPDVELDGVTRLEPSTISTKGKILFRCRSDTVCSSLLRALRQAIVRIQASNQEDDKEEAIIFDSDTEDQVEWSPTPILGEAIEGRALLSDMPEQQFTAAQTSGTDQRRRLMSDNLDKKPGDDAQTRKRLMTGCLTCRWRRIQCGKEQPHCANCIRSKRPCEGYTAPRTNSIDHTQ